MFLQNHENIFLTWCSITSEYFVYPTKKGYFLHNHNHITINIRNFTLIYYFNLFHSPHSSLLIAPNNVLNSQRIQFSILYFIQVSFASFALEPLFNLLLTFMTSELLKMTGWLFLWMLLKFVFAWYCFIIRLSISF